MERIITIQQDLTSTQVGFVADCLGDLIRGHVMPEDGEMLHRPETDRFIQACYACGFVCEGLTPHETRPLYESVMNGRTSLRDATLLGLRMFFHFLIRNDRHVGYGVVEDFVVSPYAKHAHERLRHFAGQ